MTRRAWGAFTASAVSLALLAAACGGGSNGGGNGAGGATGLSGSVVVSGSSTVQPISSLVAETFAASNPDVQISVDGPGTGDGFQLFCGCQTDINDASRPIEPDEAKACKDAGVHYVQLKIALDGITVMTNPANDAVTCLNEGDLYALFGPESEGFSSWSDANALASEVGGKGGFPDAPLDIVAPGEESGTYDAFIELAGIETTATERGLSASKAAALRPDYQASPNDNVIIQGMEGSDSALGFVGFAFAQQAAAQVKEIQIDGGSGCVAPTHDTIADGSYPLSRALFLYVNTDKLRTNDALKAFVDEYLSSEGLASVTDAGYVALPPTDVQATKQAWNEAAK